MHIEYGKKPTQNAQMSDHPLGMHEWLEKPNLIQDLAVMACAWKGPLGLTISLTTHKLQPEQFWP